MDTYYDPVLRASSVGYTYIDLYPRPVRLRKYHDGQWIDLEGAYVYDGVLWQPLDDTQVYDGTGWTEV